MKIYVKQDDQWLFPDEAALGTAAYDGQALQLRAPRGGVCAIQILADELTADMTLWAENARVMLLRPVTVQYNTAADETTDFGDKPFVHLQPVKPCPPHCTRIAPFQVYDPCIAYGGQRLQGDKQAFFVIADTSAAGERRVSVQLKSGAETVAVSAVAQVYDAGLPEKPVFAMDNWFSLEAMADRHGLKRFSPAHFAKIKEYARIMAAMRQTHFMLSPDLAFKDGRLELSLLEQVADIFFAAGLQTMKIGPIGQRKRVYHENLLALTKDGHPVMSPEGQALLQSFFEGLAKLAEKKDWLDKIVFHLGDEPDEPERVIPARLEQYAFMCQMVRRYFPAAKVCEAVKTAKFQEHIDILVPLSKTYEQDRESFDAAKEKGKQIWLYTCCVPIGNYYNRFLDAPLHSCRHLFWSIARHHITGYLHWGLNQLEERQHPFLQTNQSHTYGDGKILPAGDSHILYPDGDDIYCSVRMYIYRKSCEDVELLALLEKKDPALWQELTGDLEQFHGDGDVQLLRQRSRRLLEALKN